MPQKFVLSAPNTVAPAVVTVEIDEDDDISINFDGSSVAYIDQTSGKLYARYVCSLERDALAAKGVAFTDDGYYDVVPS